jgi:uncharacterized protein (TIGR03118 family)
LFIFVTEDGTISGWNPTVNPTHSVLTFNNSPNSVFKGVAIQLGGNRPQRLYVADFRQGKVLVLDNFFHKVDLPSTAFVDPQVPAGFAPFNVQNIGRNIYVTYAKQDADKKDDVKGPGNGYVTVFNPDGVVIQRLQHGDWMNSPWGLTLAPSDFGFFSREILVGQFGSGEIAVFSAANGAFRGKLLATSGDSLKIDGLWALSFGNGGKAGSATTLFFTAGPDDEMHGLFGSITPLLSELIQGNGQ